MRFSPAPPAVRAALAKPGRLWDEYQLLATVDWLFGDNFARLVRVAAHRLGCDLASNAEDECQNFAAGRFRRVVHNYDPTRGELEGFVVVCLRRYCGARARILARPLARTVPLDSVAVGLIRTTATAESRLLARESRSTAARYVPDLHRVLMEMSQRDRRLLQMEFRGMPLPERATVLSIGIGAAKTAACRARQRLAARLGRDTLRWFALGTGGAR